MNWDGRVQFLPQGLLCEQRNREWQVFLTMHDETILDRQALQELREDLEGAFLEFVQTVLGSARETLAAIGTALGSKDIVEVGRQAHALKGNVGYLGALRLSAQMEALQGLALAGNTEPMAGILTAALTDFSELEVQVLEFTEKS